MFRIISSKLAAFGDPIPWDENAIKKKRDAIFQGKVPKTPSAPVSQPPSPTNAFADYTVELNDCFIQRLNMEGSHTRFFDAVGHIASKCGESLVVVSHRDKNGHLSYVSAELSPDDHSVLGIVDVDGEINGEDIPVNTTVEQFRQMIVAATEKCKKTMKYYLDNYGAP